MSGSRPEPDAVGTSAGRFLLASSGCASCSDARSAMSREQKAMLEAVSDLGILMLLLLTGMETDLKLVKRARRAAVSVSAAGIAVPFVCGFVLGQFLPEAMLPRPDQRLITSMFLGTALSVASVKIVAMVVREMNFMRRGCV
jgi:K+:H+ antiporter